MKKLFYQIEHPIKSKMLKIVPIRDKFLGLMLIIILSVMILSWIEVGLVKNEIKNNIQNSLLSPLKAAQEALHKWTENRIENAHSFVADREVSLLIKELIALPRDKKTLAGSKALKKLRSFVKPLFDSHSELGMFVIAPDGINIASIRDENLGGINFLFNAFDKSGKLLSETRFDKQLKEFGLIKPNQRFAFSMTLRDPGGNMMKGFRLTKPRESLPLIRPVQKAISGEHGVDTDGYRDYRGVPVVGAWVWDDNRLSLGQAGRNGLLCRVSTCFRWEDDGRDGPFRQTDAFILQTTFAFHCSR